MFSLKVKSIWICWSCARVPITGKDTPLDNWLEFCCKVLDSCWSKFSHQLHKQVRRQQDKHSQALVDKDIHHHRLVARCCTRLCSCWSRFGRQFHIWGSRFRDRCSLKSNFQITTKSLQKLLLNEIVRKEICEEEQTHMKNRSAIEELSSFYAIEGCKISHKCSSKWIGNVHNHLTSFMFIFQGFDYIFDN